MKWIVFRSDLDMIRIRSVRNLGMLSEKTDFDYSRLSTGQSAQAYDVKRKNIDGLK
jgi:hypothetical protein